jgi:hypothetical protein
LTPIVHSDGLAGIYDYRLVALSILISILASYAALDLGGRVTASRGSARSIWLMGGAAAMGLGIWSMHYIGMLAYSLPVAILYHWPTVLLSLPAAILASAVALFVVSRKEMGPLRIGLGTHSRYAQGALLSSSKPIVLDLRELDFLNSSGITMLSRFVIEARDHTGIDLQVLASEAVPWHPPVKKSSKTHAYLEYSSDLIHLECS